MLVKPTVQYNSAHPQCKYAVCREMQSKERQVVGVKEAKRTTKLNKKQNAVFGGAAITARLSPPLRRKLTRSDHNKSPVFSD